MVWTVRETALMANGMHLGIQLVWQRNEINAFQIHFSISVFRSFIRVNVCVIHCVCAHVMCSFVNFLSFKNKVLRHRVVEDDENTQLVDAALLSFYCMFMYCGNFNPTKEATTEWRDSICVLMLLLQINAKLSQLFLDYQASPTK